MGGMGFGPPLLDMRNQPAPELPDRVIDLRLDAEQLRTELMKYAEEFVTLLGHIPDVTAERMRLYNYDPTGNR